MVSGISGPLAVFQLPFPVLTRDVQREIKRELGVRIRDQRLLAGLVELPPSTVLPSEDDCGPITLLRVKRRCHVCGRRRRLWKCAACWSTYYCGPRCQRLDWRRHKQEDACREHQKALAICAATRAKPAGAEPLPDVKLDQKCDQVGVDQRHLGAPSETVSGTDSFAFYDACRDRQGALATCAAAEARATPPEGA